MINSIFRHILVVLFFVTIISCVDDSNNDKTLKNKYKNIYITEVEDNNIYKEFNPSETDDKDKKQNILPIVNYSDNEKNINNNLKNLNIPTLSEINNFKNFDMNNITQTQSESLLKFVLKDDEMLKYITKKQMLALQMKTSDLNAYELKNIKPKNFNINSNTNKTSLFNFFKKESSFSNLKSIKDYLIAKQKEISKNQKKSDENKDTFENLMLNVNINDSVKNFDDLMNLSSSNTSTPLKYFILSNAANNNNDLKLLENLLKQQNHDINLNKKINFGDYKENIQKPIDYAIDKFLTHSSNESILQYIKLLIHHGVNVDNININKVKNKIKQLKIQYNYVTSLLSFINLSSKTSFKSILKQKYKIKTNTTLSDDLKNSIREQNDKNQVNNPKLINKKLEFLNKIIQPENNTFFNENIESKKLHEYQFELLNYILNSNKNFIKNDDLHKDEFFVNKILSCEFKYSDLNYLQGLVAVFLLSNNSNQNYYFFSSLSKNMHKIATAELNKNLLNLKTQIENFKYLQNLINQP